MKEPYAVIPKEAWSGAKKEVGVFPARLQELVKAFFATGPNFPSYEELLKIFSGGSLIQECSFCSDTMKVAAMAETRYLAVTLIRPYLSPTFCCGKDACIQAMLNKVDAWSKWSLAQKAVFNKLRISTCDFCFKLAEKVNR